MDAKRKSELLDRLRNEFDDYIDYYDLMECLPDMTEAKVENLKKRRQKNGLDEFSYYTHRNTGALMVSAAKFERWVSNNFRPLNADV